MGHCFSKTKDLAEDIVDNINDIKELGEDIKDVVDYVVDDKPVSEVIENIKDVGETTIDLIK